jgi:pimeloyl-ACP methyl ester carboxylesterase
MFETEYARYAKCGEVHVGYRVFGDGPLDIVLVSGLTSNIDVEFRAPGETTEFEALAGIARCILFDKRETGISDRPVGVPSLEERMEDVRAVMDAVASSHAVLYGRADGGAMSVLFAATYPERTVALILTNPRAALHLRSRLPVGAESRGIRTRDGRGSAQLGNPGAGARDRPALAPTDAPWRRASANRPRERRREGAPRGVGRLD